MDLQVIPARLVLPDYRPGDLGHRPHGRDHAVPRDPSEKALRGRTQIPNQIPWIASGQIQLS